MMQFTVNSHMQSCIARLDLRKNIIKGLTIQLKTSVFKNSCTISKIFNQNVYYTALPLNAAVHVYVSQNVIIYVKERLLALIRDLFTFSSKVIKSFIIV
jgi:hypothetical protein